MVDVPDSIHTADITDRLRSARPHPIGWSLEAADFIDALRRSDKDQDKRKRTSRKLRKRAQRAEAEVARLREACDEYALTLIGAAAERGALETMLARVSAETDDAYAKGLVDGRAMAEFAHRMAEQEEGG